jgi:hypothetical protein
MAAIVLQPVVRGSPSARLWRHYSGKVRCAQAVSAAPGHETCLTMVFKWHIIPAALACPILPLTRLTTVLEPPVRVSRKDFGYRPR